MQTLTRSLWVRLRKLRNTRMQDKLVVCQVNIGTEVIQIVTGAKNVFEGAKVPVVLDGGRVAGGHEPGQRVAGGIKIKKGKLRGVPSYGMMCSIEELGFYKGDVSGTAGEWYLHFPGGHRGWSRCDRTSWSS